MNVLEKILEEMENESQLAHEEMRRCVRGNPLQFDEVKGYARAMEYVVDTIRSHMDDIPNCGDCSRRKWYQKGYEDGKKDNDWIPYTEQNMPKKEGVYLVTCDDEEYPVKRMRFKKEDEYGLWYDEHGIYDGVIFAWQPLPEPYKMKENK
jgi:hypothetical protein|nr:MAG TPA: Protein of unknown function (DUF551) [Caudoviricetes sp.]